MVSYPVKECFQKSLASSFLMFCEDMLASLWFLFVIFLFETIGVWLFLSMVYLDQALYHWEDGVFSDDPGQVMYTLSRGDSHSQTEMQT